MKSIILVAVALVAIVAAAPSEYKEPSKIISSKFEQGPAGSYVFDFETEDGTIRRETGEVREALDEDNKPHKVIVVRGSYTFLNAAGIPQTITYFADETGYHAEGDAIPKIV